MAQLRGAKVMVAAPNQATNQLLLSSGFQTVCMNEAARIAQIAVSETSRDGRMSRGEKSRRYPVVVKQPIAASFRGTMRAGAVVKGSQWGMRADVVERVMNSL